MLLVENAKRRPRFLGGRRIPQASSARYLGCDINDQANVSQELTNRMRSCTGTWRRLEFLWKHSECPRVRKIQLWDAILKTKLLYGLEALQVQPPLMNKLETFHLRGLRQILKITTTYVDRTHTNEYVYAQATEAVRRRARGGAQAAGAEVRPLRMTLTDKSIKVLGDLLRKPNADPMSTLR